MTTIRYTPVLTTGDEGAKIVTSGESAPTTTAHGVACRGFGVATFYLKATSLTAATVKFYVSFDDGTTWVESSSDEVTMTTRDDAARLLIEGATRVAARVTALTGTSVTRTLVLA